MERLEAVPINNPGEPIRAALRKGTLVVIALRLGPGEWKPLYAINGLQRVSLPPRFCWTLEAIDVLEGAAFGA